MGHPYSTAITAQLLLQVELSLSDAPGFLQWVAAVGSSCV